MRCSTRSSTPTGACVPGPCLARRPRGEPAARDPAARVAGSLLPRDRGGARVVGGGRRNAALPGAALAGAEARAGARAGLELGRPRVRARLRQVASRRCHREGGRRDAGRRRPGDRRDAGSARPRATDAQNGRRCCSCPPAACCSRAADAHRASGHGSACRACAAGPGAEAPEPHGRPTACAPATATRSRTAGRYGTPASPTAATAPRVNVPDAPVSAPPVPAPPIQLPPVPPPPALPPLPPLPPVPTLPSGGGVPQLPPVPPLLP